MRTSERGATVTDLVVGLFATAVLVGLISCGMRDPQDTRTGRCGNNLRNIGLGVFQYAERYGQMMPTAYRNTWAGLAPHLGVRTDDMRMTDLFRCGHDKFLSDQPPWGEGNQCSYAPNADETGTDALNVGDWAGWSVTVGTQHFGAQYSPFSGRFSGGDTDEEAIVRLDSVATDTILLAECWRANTQNSLFLNDTEMRMRMTSGVPVVKTRNALLLKQYTAATGCATNAAGQLTNAGPFNFLSDYVGTKTLMSQMYHDGKMNVLYGDGHCELQSVRELCTGPGAGRWTAMAMVAEIPQWNRFED